MPARRRLFELLAGLAVLSCDEPPAVPTNAGGATSSAAGATSAGAAASNGAAGSCGEDAPPNAWPSWPLPDPTSQGTKVAQRYTASGPDIVLDDVTQLSWQRQLSEQTYTWDEARQYCDCLTLGEHDDFQLPSRVELLSIVDFTRQDPALDPVAFPDTPFEWFWSASPLAGSDSIVWYIAFFDGNTHLSGKDSQYRVRCVRHATGSDPHYTLAGDGTVADAATSLTWQQAPSPERLAWAEAGQYCSDLELAGGGFRLPDMKELQSLVDEQRTEPAIDPAAFPDTPSEGFWAATPLAGAPAAAWFVNFASGVSYNTVIGHAYRARCVR